jgi:hypothetical protein
MLLEELARTGVAAQKNPKGEAKPDSCAMRAFSSRVI